MMNSGFDCDVLVVGAGPTGLAAALSLAVQGVHVRIVDDMPLRHATPRASSIHARTLEVYRRELRAIDSQYPAHQNLQQWHAEWIIAEQLMARTVTVEASTRAAGLVQDGGGVTAHIETDAGASALRCRSACRGSPIVWPASPRRTAVMPSRCRIDHLAIKMSVAAHRPQFGVMRNCCGPRLRDGSRTQDMQHDMQYDMLHGNLPFNHGTTPAMVWDW